MGQSRGRAARAQDDPFLPWEEQQAVADGLRAQLHKFEDKARALAGHPHPTPPLWLPPPPHTHTPLFTPPSPSFA